MERIEQWILPDNRVKYMSGVCTAAEIKSWSRQLPNCLYFCVVMQTDNDVTVTSREFPRHFRHVSTRTDNFCCC